MRRNYTRDHVAVLKVLGREMPKKPALSTEEIHRLGFRDQDNADRVIRNAYRKLRADGLIEIADRGMYRLTSSGVSLMKQVKEKKIDLTNIEKGPEKKKSKKKEAKKVKKVRSHSEPVIPEVVVGYDDLDDDDEEDFETR